MIYCIQIYWMHEVETDHIAILDITTWIREHAKPISAFKSYLQYTVDKHLLNYYNYHHHYYHHYNIHIVCIKGWSFVIIFHMFSLNGRVKNPLLQWPCLCKCSKRGNALWCYKNWSQNKFNQTLCQFPILALAHPQPPLQYVPFQHRMSAILFLAKQSFHSDDRFDSSSYILQKLWLFSQKLGKDSS